MACKEIILAKRIIFDMCMHSFDLVAPVECTLSTYRYRLTGVYWTHLSGHRITINTSMNIFIKLRQQLRSIVSVLYQCYTQYINTTLARLLYNDVLQIYCGVHLLE